jgi:hypothetical protein
MARDGAAPRYTHDCDRCVFMGRVDSYDLYVCPQARPLPTAVARKSSDPPDYSSAPLMVVRDSPPEGIFMYLRLARRWAIIDMVIPETW